LQLGSSPEFALWYGGALLEAGGEAFFWEHPPLRTDRLGGKAEVVLLDSPVLARSHPDPSAFEGHFHTSPRAQAVAFPNLGGDALLIAPCPIKGSEGYPHLAAFLRRGPETQHVAFWAQVSSSVLEALQSAEGELRWISSAGLGVSWLHLRIDRRPKYYRHREYRTR
jgi:hypothetical protein